MAQGDAAADNDPPIKAALALHHPTDRVWLDQTGDGRIWARGSNWKASFDNTGMAFVPFLGSTAPRNFPLALRVLGAEAGAHTLPSDLQAPARVVGDRRVEIAHGPLTEVYLLAPDHVEQQFVYVARPAPGPLSVRMAIESELTAHAEGDGSYTFRNELGGVRYGAATAIDASGNSCRAASRVTAGVLTLTVPAEFVAHADFPLTIDPVFSTIVVSPYTPPLLQYMAPDIAFVATNGGLYAAVVEEIYSTTDHDIYVGGIAATGATVTSAFVDYTTDSWSAPKIASNRGASQFLCVAERAQPTYSVIWARTITFGLSGSTPFFTLSNQFSLQITGTGHHPDVGGDPNPSPPPPGNYCVTWTGNNNSLYYDIVRTDTSRLFPSGQVVPTGMTSITNPSISKSSGVGAANTQQWIIVWQQTYAPGDEDIYATMIGSTGIVDHAAVLVSASSLSDSNPQVSSKTDLLGGVEKWVAVYQRFIPGTLLTNAHTDLYASLFAGTSQLTFPTNLTSLFGRPPGRSDHDACIDTDGTRFAIGFSEQSSVFSLDVVPYLATVHIVNGATLAVTSAPESTNAYAGPDDHMQITSQRSGGAFTADYLSVWDVASTTNAGIDSLGARYGGYTNLPPSAYFDRAVIGCGTITIAASGLPALGETCFLDLASAQALPFLLLGYPAAVPFPVCTGCTLGVDLATMFATYTASYALTVPQDTTLIGQRWAAQGLDFLATGGCSIPWDLTLSDAIYITIL